MSGQAGGGGQEIFKGGFLVFLAGRTLEAGIEVIVEEAAEVDFVESVFFLGGRSVRTELSRLGGRFEGFTGRGRVELLRLAVRLRDLAVRGLFHAGFRRPLLLDLG